MLEDDQGSNKFSRRTFIKKAFEGTGKIAAAALLPQFLPDAPPEPTPDTAPLVQGFIEQKQRLPTVKLQDVKQNFVSV